MNKQQDDDTYVSQDEFEDLVLNSSTKDLRRQLRLLSKMKGTKWEQNYIRKELRDRRPFSKIEVF